jgi:[protein-PII] uridylyltransferase
MADIRGTSPKVWNAWKDKLTRELYLAARRVLEGNAPSTDDIEEKKEQARAQLRLYGFAAGQRNALWNRLDDIYFLRQDARDIGWQTRRLLPVLDHQEAIVRARLAPVGEGVEVLVFAPDEEALFARICAFFARLGYSILAARIHTTHDGRALDTFYALDQEHPQVPYRDFLNYIEHELAAELTRHTPLGVLPAGRRTASFESLPAGTRSQSRAQRQSPRGRPARLCPHLHRRRPPRPAGASRAGPASPAAPAWSPRGSIRWAAAPKTYSCWKAKRWNAPRSGWNWNSP